MTVAEATAMLEEVREPSTAEPPPVPPWKAVPWRTIVGTVAVVAATLLLTIVIYRASRIIVWVAIAGFFAVVLNGPVSWFERRCHMRRGLAIGTVVVIAVAVTLGLVALFLLPVRAQAAAALSDLPGTVRDAAQGRGPLGGVIKSLGLERLVADHESELTNTATSISSAMPGALLRGILATLTIAVMTCLLLSQSAALATAGRRLIPPRHHDRATELGRLAAHAVSGYMVGNLVISACAGGAAFLFLFVCHVPSAVVLALWVAFADLIPLVGATLGAVAAIAASFLVSPGVGIAAIVFFIVYQQFENSVLQLVVMKRAVSANPLVVLLSILMGVELFGVVGALLAVPLAGAASAVMRQLWLQRSPSGEQLVMVTDDAEV